MVQKHKGLRTIAKRETQKQKIVRTDLPDEVLSETFAGWKRQCWHNRLKLRLLSVPFYGTRYDVQNQCIRVDGRDT